MVIASAGAGLRATFAVPKPSPLTYVEKNMIGIFGLILLVGFLPDAFFRHLLMPSHLTTLNLALDLIELATGLWICGAYGTMANKPHELSGSTFTLNFGAFASIEIPLDAIDDARAVPESESRRELRRREGNAAFFSAPGSGLVRLALTRRIEFRSYPYLRKRQTDVLFVPSDRPTELAALLKGRVLVSA